MNLFKPSAMEARLSTLIGNEHREDLLLVAPIAEPKVTGGKWAWLAEEGTWPAVEGAWPAVEGAWPPVFTEYIDPSVW